MKGDTRCIDGRIWRHDPQWDDPDLETDVGKCPCDGSCQPPLYRCTACEAESEGDPPDCPRDGVHCNVVEVG